MHLGGPNSTHNSSILNSQHECQFCSYSPDWFLASRGVGVNHAQPQEAGAAPVSAGQSLGCGLREKGRDKALCMGRCLCTCSLAVALRTAENPVFGVGTVWERKGG